MNRRILFFPGALKLGGVGRLTLNLAEEFLKNGYSVDIFLTKCEGDYLSKIPEEVRVFMGGGSAKMSLFRLIRYINREKPDAVISARDYLNYVNIICGKLSFHKAKIISSVHVDTSGQPETNKIGQYLMNRLGRVLYGYSDTIIAVSKGVAADLKKRCRLKKDNIKVIYNPVFTSDVSKSKDLHGWLGNRRHKVVVGMGRFVEQKNFRLLIEAFGILRETIDAKLIIFGEGPQRKELGALIERLGLRENVDLPGYIDNPTYQLSHSDVFVLSSSWEGFGNVIVEALGVGTPVVSTDCPSGPAEILEYGKYGRLVPLNEPCAMADAIMATLHNPPPRALLINRAKEYAITGIARKYLAEIYPHRQGCRVGGSHRRQR